MEMQVLEMSHRCTYCSNPGHNSRTCPNRGIKIFGVRIANGPIVKSASTGNIRRRYVAARAPEEAGYTSEANPARRERKKVVQWTEEEHRMFLVGLIKLGRGDWRGIARNYVASRTPTQVASHAQKFFIRQNSGSKRRTSLFDLAPAEIVDAPMRSVEPDVHGNTAQPVPPALEKESDVRDSNSNSNSNDGEGSIPKTGSLPFNYAVLYPTFVPPSYPYFPFQYWPGYNAEPKEQGAHEILKPTAVRVKAPINVDELMGMSKLNLADSFAAAGPSIMSLK